ncbi:hypothetical protein CONCODRAFT_11935 [Conidiobolus coronatus NRRL 28638]|uniref:F-box domain-containing protein n=1 Tax=Conidiobolus coronatus (strain ATCC 28846 / CBS 209.66 / NRRL 28638) TaxID=796925 RepID=A0A137NU76_CONC2|nr:hypothetical protein CONCODRAFT_11935 [Conidiobolus coronatus NRRL 28638]|eukprot:KXN66268.1 hypothetical protein CONCODRAFT_11935 [Conidiobolus coronatus NRRL 28638]
MNNSDWNTIIKLKEFNENLSNKDLIQLSMSSKKSRNNLTKEAFNTFNLLSFTSSKDYSSISFDEKAGKYGDKFDTFINPFKPLSSKLIESKMKFINDLKQFNVSPKSLLVYNYREYHYLLSEISNIFANITFLAFNRSTFTADVLHSLFENLKSLEKLELTCNLIIYNKENSNDYSITFPISLRSLKLSGNGAIAIQDKIKSTVNDKYVVDVRTYQHLPNLKNFEHFMGFSSPGDKEELFEFIKLNPQLNSLKLSGDAFYFDLFDIIKDCENLTNLKLNCVIYMPDLIDYQIPQLQHIKHLHLVFVDEDYESFLKYRLHNVTEFILESYGEYTRKNKRFIEKFTKLKSLKFIFKKEFDYSKKISINGLANLENIEVNFNYEKGSFNPMNFIVKTCKKLKLITFTKNPSQTPFEDLEENQNHIKNWGYLYFPYKLTYYKIA